MAGQPDCTMASDWFLIPTGLRGQVYTTPEPRGSNGVAGFKAKPTSMPEARWDGR